MTMYIYPCPTDAVRGNYQQRISGVPRKHFSSEVITLDKTQRDSVTYLVCDVDGVT